MPLQNTPLLNYLYCRQSFLLSNVGCNNGIAQRKASSSECEETSSSSSGCMIAVVILPIAYYFSKRRIYFRGRCRDGRSNMLGQFIGLFFPVLTRKMKSYENYLAIVKIRVYQIHRMNYLWKCTASRLGCTPQELIYVCNHIHIHLASKMNRFLIHRIGITSHEFEDKNYCHQIQCPFLTDFSRTFCFDVWRWLPTYSIYLTLKLSGNHHQRQKKPKEIAKRY